MSVAIVWPINSFRIKRTTSESTETPMYVSICVRWGWGRRGYSSKRGLTAITANPALGCPWLTIVSWVFLVGRLNTACQPAFLPAVPTQIFFCPIGRCELQCIVSILQIPSQYWRSVFLFDVRLTEPSKWINGY